MMNDSQYTALCALPQFWAGRAQLRLILAEEPGCDPVLQRRHLAIALGYEAEAERLRAMS